MDAPWTPDLVERQLVEAFTSTCRRAAIVPVFSSRSGLLRPAIPRPRPATQKTAEALDVLNWPERFVRDSRRRRALLFWARAKATRENVAEFCREMGVPRSTFERWRSEAAREIASALASQSSEVA